jgi:hypothetical protein
VNATSQEFCAWRQENRVLAADDKGFLKLDMLFTWPQPGNRLLKFSRDVQIRPASVARTAFASGTEIGDAAGSRQGQQARLSVLC